jgi:hypothetical protein
VYTSCSGDVRIERTANARVSAQQVGQRSRVGSGQFKPNIMPGAKLQNAPLGIFNLQILHLSGIISDDCFN